MKNKYIFETVFLILISCTAVFSQGINLMNGGKIKISNNAYVVINTSSANGIKTTGSGNAVVSEGENNRIKWNLGTATGTYQIPFRNNAGVNIPVTVNKTTSGTVATSGYFIFSTYSTNPQNSALPSDVTNLNDAYLTIDRFWIIEPNGYSSKPDITITMGYDVTEINSPNTITESRLGAQRFNNSLNTWNDFAPSGTVNTTNKTVASVAVAGTDLYRSFTLVDNSVPLPVELIDFSYECQVTEIKLKWTTAFEINNDKFLIEKTENLETPVWKIVGTVKGAGFSAIPQSYSIKDTHPGGKNVYYRLKQIDYDGKHSREYILPVNCIHSRYADIKCYMSGNYIVLNIDAHEVCQYLISIFDLAGNILKSEQINVQEGSNIFVLECKGFSSGVYLLELKNDYRVFTKKILYLPAGN